MHITYLLGAGASFYSLPIWKAQGQSMIDLANRILGEINDNKLANDPKLSNYSHLHNNEKLKEIFEKLKEFGQKAIEYGTIDVYARRLYLLGDNVELNDLKFSLSVYLDIWESGPMSFFERDRNDTGLPIFYDNIDKRYLSLLSILLEKEKNSFSLKENIKFITWNYDLQIEKAFNSFSNNENLNLTELDRNFRFLETSSSEKSRDIIHLNGHRGMFKFQNETYEAIEDKSQISLLSCLSRILDNKSFETHGKKLDYNNFIKYAWEASPESLQEAKGVMSNTNILIIIGYSFPAFNRKLDLELIRQFEENKLENKRVVYQDLNCSSDIIKALLKSQKLIDSFVPIKNCAQFYLPPEILN